MAPFFLALMDVSSICGAGRKTELRALPPLPVVGLCLGAGGKERAVRERVVSSFRSEPRKTNHWNSWRRSRLLLAA